MKTPHFPTHECGVFAVYNHPNAAELTYYGLYALQHRGQESAGIVTAKDDGKAFTIKRGMGLVGQIFKENDLKELTGTRAIGHVRYSTTGSSTIKNAQPLTVETGRGQIAIAHNGNLVNAGKLRDELEAGGSIFQTTTDSEIILHLISRPNPAIGGGALAQALSRVHGAYSLVLMGENEVIAARDPFGFRPLVIGKLDDAIIFASETCALDLVGAEFVRDVEPGEIVVADESGMRSFKPHAETAREALCIFELFILHGPTVRLGDEISAMRGRGWGESWRGCILWMRTLWCRFLTRGPMRRWGIRSRRGFRWIRRLSGITTLGDRFCSRPS